VGGSLSPSEAAARRRRGPPPAPMTQGLLALFLGLWLSTASPADVSHLVSLLWPTG